MPPFLASHEVTHILAGGMGPRAMDLFCKNNIEVFLGIRGKIETVIKDFMAGKIAQAESSCTHAPITNAVGINPRVSRALSRRDDDHYLSFGDARSNIQKSREVPL